MMKKTTLSENSQMDKNERRKRDRTARLLNVMHLLYQNPKGLMIEEIARRCNVSKRTTYRDLKALEFELGIPISEEGSKRGIVEGHILPPIHFTVPEALNIFLSARLMLNYAHRYDPNMASIFFKLNSIVPPPLREEIQKTIDWLQGQPKNERYLRTLATLAEAWISRRQIKMSYKALHEKEPEERIIEPYFIEPAAAGHSSYVIAYCHRTKSQRTFKIERIEDIEATSEPYVIPPDFDANEFLGSSWGIVVKGEVKTIRLRFDPEIARIMEETIWHHSQVLEPQNDSSVIMTLRVTNTVELYSWILGWGEKVEVLEPVELRQRIIETAKAMLDVYREE
jgi:predicted DNA-binding transcriptional regulator YafY